jgi:hypothetical protein
MASVEETLAAFPDDIEPEPALVKRPPPKGTRTYPSPDETDRCFTAVKAAMETVGGFCGEKGFPVSIAGVNIRIAPSILMISRMDLGIPREDHIRIIRDSTWFKQLSDQLCGGMRGLASGTPEYEECVAKIEELVVEQLVK